MAWAPTGTVCVVQSTVHANGPGGWETVVLLLPVRGPCPTGGHEDGDGVGGMSATKVREARLGNETWRQFYNLPRLGAEYECAECRHRWTGEAGPVTCLACGSPWVAWVNYSRMFPANREMKGLP